MYALLIKLLFVVFIVYLLMATFICARDLIVKRGSKLWIPLASIIVGAVILVIATQWIPALALPLTLAISGPIFLTDKRRNWDGLDQAFRWVSLAAILGAAFVTINYFMR